MSAPERVWSYCTSDEGEGFWFPSPIVRKTARFVFVEMFGNTYRLDRAELERGESTGRYPNTFVLNPPERPTL